jgi:hypothetical protein
MSINKYNLGIGIVCGLLLVCGGSDAKGNPGDDKADARWSSWTHDDKILPELYVRSRCTKDPDNGKKSRWEIQFSDIGSSLVRVKDKDWKFDVRPQEQAGNARIETKSCSKPLDLKMDGSVPSKGYAYKLTYKRGTLTVKPHEPVDWMGYALAGMAGATAGMNGQPAPQR